MESYVDVSSVHFVKMVDKGRLTPQQRVNLVLLYVETKSLIVMQKEFCEYFNTKRTPAKSVIYNLYWKFGNNGSVRTKMLMWISSLIATE